MREMFHRISERLSSGEDLVLVTPRGAGARMLVGIGGRICGTIGGGAVEYRSEKMAEEVLVDKRSFEHGFNLTKDDVQKLGMICGGAVTVFFGYLKAGDQQTLEIARKAEEYYAAGRNLWRTEAESDSTHRKTGMSAWTRRTGYQKSWGAIPRASSLTAAISTQNRSTPRAEYMYSAAGM